MRRHSVLRKYGDLILAGGLCIASLSCSLLAYGAIRSSENQPKLLASSIADGRHYFSIISNNTCVGQLHTRVKHTSVYGIRINGELRATYGRHPITSSLDLESFFNPLGQLSRANLSLNTDLVSVTVTANDVMPIKLVATISAGLKTIQHETSLRGPVTIVKNKDGSFRIEHIETAFANDSISAQIAQTVLGDLELRVEAAPDKESVCGSMPRGSLDITAPVLKLGSLVSPIKNFVLGPGAL